jgi:hypothetical protein
MIERKEKVDKPKAALEAGYSEGGATAAAYKNMANEKFLAYLMDAMIDAGVAKLEKKKTTLNEKLNEDWIVKLMKNLAMNSKQDSVKGQMLIQLGKKHDINMWTERIEQIDVPHDREKILERIAELNKKHGIPTVGSPARDVPGSGGAGKSEAAEQAGGREADADTEGFSLGHIRSQAVQRGERVGEVGDSGDGHGASDDRPAPATGSGEDGEAAGVL